MIYYDINHLTHDGHPSILLLLPSGEEQEAIRTTYPKRNRPPVIVWKVKVWDAETRKYKAVPLPRWIIPTRWRPISAAKFPYELPKPAHVMADVAWQSPPEPAPVSEGAEDLEWRGAYHHAPDISPEEARIRVLRALRTLRAKGEKGISSGGDSAGPAGYIDSLVLVSRGVLRAEFIDTNKLAAIALPWEPSRQDRDDMLTAMAWYCRVTKKDQEIIRKRSYAPAWSFRQIGDGEGISPQAAQQRYGKALASVHWWANRS